MSETIETTVPACTMLLPRNLGALAKCCAKDSANKFAAVSSVQLTRTETGYRAMATDCRTAVIVEGIDPYPASEYPAVPALASAPNSASTANIHADYWASAFKALPKRVCTRPILSNLAVVMGENVTTLVSTNLELDNVQTPRNVEGRFPAILDVIPTGRPLASFTVNASHFGRILETAALYTDDDHFGVTISVYAGEKPIKLASQNREQRFTGLVVPLSATAKPRKYPHKKRPELPAILRTIANLSRVWSAHAIAADAGGSGRRMHAEISQRCKSAHAALTAKYLS